MFVAKDYLSDFGIFYITRISISSQYCNSIEGDVLSETVAQPSVRQFSILCLQSIWVWSQIVDQFIERCSFHFGQNNADNIDFAAYIIIRWVLKGGVAPLSLSSTFIIAKTFQLYVLKLSRGEQQLPRRKYEMFYCIPRNNTSVLDLLDFFIPLPIFNLQMKIPLSFDLDCCPIQSMMNLYGARKYQHLMKFISEKVCKCQKVDSQRRFAVLVLPSSERGCCQLHDIDLDLQY